MVHSRSVEHPAADLSTCDREPIHVPGAIQPHGVLLAVEERANRVVQVSENAAALLGRDAGALLHERIDNVLGVDAVRAIRERLAGPPGDVNPVPLDVPTDVGQRAFDAIVHRVDDVLVVELEPADPAPPEAIERFFSSVRSGIARLQGAASVESVCDTLVEEVSRVAGFDRSMVYKFDRDWHGEVVAERRLDPSLPPFLALHYPASDIPRQARELYRRNPLRLIPDARYTPAAIVPSINPMTERPLDLSTSVLRSVSPVHLEYLANMGVVASMSVSLLKHGELWGLVSVHHGTARFVPYRVRITCELLAHTASLQITSLEERSEYTYRMRLRALQPALLDAVSREGTFSRAVAGSELLEIADATGAAIKTEGEPILVGASPRLRHVRQILAWLGQREGGDPQEPFVTDSLALMNPAFEEFKDTASGLLAVPLATTQGGWLLWFRPEVVRTVTWSGDPHKPVQGVEGRVSPRKSFDAWKETVALHARPWEDAQIDAAVELRRLLSDVMMRRAREYARLNAELTRSNQELESFAHVASHDLKEPLRGVSHYAQFLLEDYGAAVDERGREMLRGMQGLAKRMEAQIESMLQLARVGEEQPAARRTELDPVLDEALALLAPRIEQEGALVVRAPLPAALIGRARAREVFVNLISNALKYNERSPKVVEIGVSEKTGPGRASSTTSTPADGPTITIFVKDNGIGIREKHLETVFRMFKRLHPGDRYGGGTGAGLAIARKIVEQNGGAMWVESSDEGSTFYFNVPVTKG